MWAILDFRPHLLVGGPLSPSERPLGNGAFSVVGQGCVDVLLQTPAASEAETLSIMCRTSTGDSEGGGDGSFQGPWGSRDGPWCVPRVFFLPHISQTRC